ncbi:MAG: hypothetical protein Q7S37_05170 [bacterium]|nr:hypothetical protein [bacterium]
MIKYDSKKTTIFLLLYICLAQFTDFLLHLWFFIPILILTIFYSAKEIKKQEFLHLAINFLIFYLILERVIRLPYLILTKHGYSLAISIILSILYICFILFIINILTNLGIKQYRKKLPLHQK